MSVIINHIVMVLNHDITIGLIWLFAGLVFAQRLCVALRYQYTIKSRAENWLIVFMVLGSFVYLTLVLFDLSDHEMRRALLRLIWIWMLGVEFWIGNREALRRRRAKELYHETVAVISELETLKNQDQQSGQS